MDKRLRNGRLLVWAAVAGASLLTRLASGASIIQTDSVLRPSQMAFPASSSDLIQAGSPYLAAAVHTGYTPFTASGTTSTAALTDGLLGTNSINANTAFDLDGTWTSTYTLDLVGSPLGYEITEVRTLSGWVGARLNQKHTLSVSYVSNPGVFVPLGTFSYSPGGDGSAQIALTDTTGVIATGVEAIRFDILPIGTQTVYREIDVFGGPLVFVPAPTAATLLAPLVGLLVLCRTRTGA